MRKEKTAQLKVYLTIEEAQTVKILVDTMARHMRGELAKTYYSEKQKASFHRNLASATTVAEKMRIVIDTHIHLNRPRR